ncbi:Histone deacetylase hda1 [Ceratobasidium sp. 395]|nr:Histone deacetylase hda1 [Ceratobasidium sp. 395]
MEKLPIRPVRRNEVMLVHTKDLVDKVEALQNMTNEHIVQTAMFYDQLSLYVTQPTTRAAALSCGGVIECALAVARGHQAFEDDPNVLYISIHRYDDGTFYPGGTYGSMNSVGTGEGRGKSVNIPWPTGDMGDADYMYAFLSLVMPIAYEFAPQFVILSEDVVSAGFDAAMGDELGQCEVTPSCYGHMTALLCTLAGGKVAVALEGGYNLNSISKSAVAVVRALLGDPLPELPKLEASDIATEVVWQVARVQSQYWHCINPTSLEPKEDVDETVIFLPELFKSWRREHSAKEFNLFEFPWATPELDDTYKGQLLVSGNLSKQHTLVFFVHDFGNVGAEILSVSQLDIEMENTWIFPT